MKKTGLFLIFILCLCNLNTYAARYYVKTNSDDLNTGTTWETSFATLTKAASVTQSGDEVWVAWGVFMEGKVITIDEEVSFHGGFKGTENQIQDRDEHTSPTKIHGNSSNRCVINKGLLDRFCILGGVGDNGGGVYNCSSGTITFSTICYNSSIECGGGVYNSGTMTNCIVYDNHSSKHGGGIFNNMGMLSNNTIYNNKAEWMDGGGGIYNLEGTITNCNVYGNEQRGIYSKNGEIFDCAVYDNQGGGIYNNNGEVNDSQIYRNSASYGSGIHNEKGIVNNCVIYENILKGRFYGGAGIYNNSGTVTNCIIYGNSCINYYYSYGGGISNYGYVENCHIYGNKAITCGGVANESSGIMVNCVVYSNTATGKSARGAGIGNYGKAINCIVYSNIFTNINTKGGGIYNSGSVINCTIYKNPSEGIYNNSGGTVTNCISWKNDGLDISGDNVQYSCYTNASSANGNISKNPFFENLTGDLSAWDFHLKNGSPCIDAGTTDTLELPDTDIEGNPRPGGDGKVCMGAYESPDEYLPGETMEMSILYVKTDGNDEDSGTSWGCALKTITKAIYLSYQDDNMYEIRVAQGGYKEAKTIINPSFVTLCGGYSGIETDAIQRDISLYKTIISGNNKYQCVYNMGALDGFYIKYGGSEEGGGVYNNCGTVSNCRIENNKAYEKGGGIYNYKGIVTNSEIYDNAIRYDYSYGGGIYNQDGTIKNCAVYRNKLYGDYISGAGIRNINGQVDHCHIYDNTLKGSNATGSGIKNSYGTIKNSSISGNSIWGNPGNGSGIYNLGDVINCIVDLNTGNSSGAIYNSGKLVNSTIYKNNDMGVINSGIGTVINSISWKNKTMDIQGAAINSCYGGAPDENGNISANPLFENTSGDSSTWDLRLKNGSPCIDAGKLEGSPEQDIDGKARPGGDGKVCMGAYESPDESLPGEPEPLKRLYVKPSGNDEESGTSWDEALKTITKALNRSFQDDNVYEIWAAKGAYNENTTINIPISVSLYGGFTGVESLIEQRVLADSPTIIEGRNIYRCVQNYGVINGFHVTMGRSNEGGGIKNTYGKVENCNIYGNNASEVGGGIHNANGIVIRCTISGNNANRGGGVYNGYGTITHCQIYGNQSTYTAGGILNIGTMANCLVFGNITEESGGGIYNHYASATNCIVFGNKVKLDGGGIKNMYSEINNCTVYGNQCLRFGGGIYSYSSTISNSIIWNNSFDIYDEGETVINSSCYGNATGINGNISAYPMFVNGSGDMLVWDFHLHDDSLCIDAGDPNSEYNDGCLPPGKGAERNDMGAYGGPGNCEFPEIIPPKTVLGVLTEYTDFWGAKNPGSPPFEEANRRGWLGFRFSPSKGWYVLKGDADQFGLEDLIQVTEYGDAWVSKSFDNINSEPTRWGWLGFKYDERDGYNGWLPIASDANGDDACDLIQITEYGDAWVAPSELDRYAEPERWGWLGFEFSRGNPGENGAIPLSGDANGDGFDDLIQITRYRDVWVACSGETIYNPPTRWGWLGFKYAPYDGWYPLCGDVNADGKDDLVQITPTGDPWVALSQGDSYTSPSRWGWIGFYYNEELGYYPLLEDVNADGRKDLIQITPEGETWVTPALDGTFDVPEYWGKPGFIFSRERKYLPFFLDN